MGLSSRLLAIVSVLVTAGVLHGVADLVIRTTLDVASLYLLHNISAVGNSNVGWSGQGHSAGGKKGNKLEDLHFEGAWNFNKSPS